MGLEKVKQEIIEKAGKEADSTIGEAKQEEASILSEAQKKVDEYREKAKIETTKILENIKKKETASAHLDVKKLKLDKKKEMIDIAFDEVSQKIEKMDSKKRILYVKNLVNKAKQEIDVKYVHANKKDKAAVNSIKGVDYVESDIIGGIIAETANKEMNVDYSFEEILQDTREKSLQEIAKILF